MPRIKNNNRTPRERGSVYILVLGASLLVVAIGVSSLMAARIQRKTVTVVADRGQARELARTAIDRGLWLIKHNSLTWRTIFQTGVINNETAFGGGTFSLIAVDPVDNDLLDDNTDPVILIGDGKKGNARYVLRVTLNGDGTVRGGTWQRVVEEN